MVTTQLWLVRDSNNKFAPLGDHTMEKIILLAAQLLIFVRTIVVVFFLGVGCHIWIPQQSHTMTWTVIIQKERWIVSKALTVSYTVWRKLRCFVSSLHLRCEFCGRWNQAQAMPNYTRFSKKSDMDFLRTHEHQNEAFAKGLVSWEVWLIFIFPTW